MKRMLEVIAVLALLSAATALAGDKVLYIKAKDVKLLKEAKAGSAAVSPSVLPVGTEVKWLGADAKDKSFHQIEISGGKKGFVLMSNLGTSKPVAEIAGDGKGMSAQAFASSGAATKGLTAAGVKYAGQDAASAAADVVYIEELTKAKATDAAVAAKARELGGGK